MGATYYVSSANGSASYDGSAATWGGEENATVGPWAILPGQAGFAAQLGATSFAGGVEGDPTIVYVERGSLWDGSAGAADVKLTPPDDYITYTGYGDDAAGSRSITLPEDSDYPVTTTSVSIDKAVDERGCWEIRRDWTVANAASMTVVNLDSKIGITFEDFRFRAYVTDITAATLEVPDGKPCLKFTDGDTLVLRRGEILGGSSSNMGNPVKGVLAELCAFKYAAEDSIMLSAVASNNWFDGRTARFVNCQIGDCNKGSATAETATNNTRGGDPLQLNGTAYTGADNNIHASWWNGRFEMERCYLYQEAPIKQGLLVEGAPLGIYVYRCLFQGFGGGHANLLFHHQDGDVDILKTTFINPNPTFPVIRFGLAQQWYKNNCYHWPPYLLKAGKTITIDIKVNGVSGTMLYAWENNKCLSAMTSPGVPDWAPGTLYYVGNAVKSGGEPYLCHTQHTSGSSFSATNWKQLERSGVDVYFPCEMQGAIVVQNCIFDPDSVDGDSTVEDGGANATLVEAWSATARTQWMRDTASLTISDNFNYPLVRKTGSVPIPALLLPPVTYTKSGWTYTEHPVLDTTDWAGLVVTDNFFRRTDAHQPYFQIGVNDDEAASTGVTTWADGSGTSGTDKLNANLDGASGNTEDATIPDSEAGDVGWFVLE